MVTSTDCIGSCKSNYHKIATTTGNLGCSLNIDWGRRGRDRMVVGFTTIYAISAYHHQCGEFESRFGRGVYVIKFVSDL